MFLFQSISNSKINDPTRWPLRVRFLCLTSQPGQTSPWSTAPVALSSSATPVALSSSATLAYTLFISHTYSHSFHQPHLQSLSSSHTVFKPRLPNYPLSFYMQDFSAASIPIIGTAHIFVTWLKQWLIASDGQTRLWCSFDTWLKILGP